MPPPAEAAARGPRPDFSDPAARVLVFGSSLTVAAASRLLLS